jgi:hypothetical protein
MYHHFHLFEPWICDPIEEPGVDGPEEKLSRAAASDCPDGYINPSPLLPCFFLITQQVFTCSPKNMNRTIHGCVSSLLLLKAFGLACDVSSLPPLFFVLKTYDAPRHGEAPSKKVSQAVHGCGPLKHSMAEHMSVAGTCPRVSLCAAPKNEQRALPWLLSLFKGCFAFDMPPSIKI